METRANFILIGVFSLAAILGTLGFFIWLANVQIDRQYATYGILFEDVSGLDASGDVFFNGIAVGKVIGLEIYQPDPSKVLTTIEIDATTPIRTDTVAQLNAQGVTGVSYISLAGGTFGAAAPVATDGNPPLITAQQSSLQALVEGAPDLLEQATQVMEQLKAMTGPENQTSVANILRNLDTSSQRLDQAMTDFSSITTTVSEATAQITLFTNRLDTIGETATTTLELANDALISAQKAFESADTALVSSGQAIKNAEGAFAQAQDLMNTKVPQILDGVSQAVTAANTAITDLQGRSGQAIDGFGQTADLMNARLTELEVTLSDASTAFTAVTEASDEFWTLIDGEGTLMVADARTVLGSAQTAIASVEAVVTDDVPAIVADVRAAVATASAAVDKVAKDLTGLTGRLDPMAAQAEQTLASANDLFGRAQTSLGALDTALGSADAAFVAATGVMDTDLGPMLTDLREAAGRISTSVEDVTRDVPAIAAELRALVARSDAVVAQVQTAIAAATPGITEFATSGLPELKRLGVEARGLVTTLNSLARRIERDPARFLLDGRVPEYRR